MRGREGGRERLKSPLINEQLVSSRLEWNVCFDLLDSIQLSRSILHVIVLDVAQEMVGLLHSAVLRAWL